MKNFPPSLFAESIAIESGKKKRKHLKTLQGTKTRKHGKPRHIIFNIIHIALNMLALTTKYLYKTDTRLHDTVLQFQNESTKRIPKFVGPPRFNLQLCCDSSFSKSAET